MVAEDEPLDKQRTNCAGPQDMMWGAAEGRMKTTKLRTRRAVVVNDRMQQGYRYDLVRPMGRGFAPDFRPQLTPKQMLRLGVFGGKYVIGQVKTGQ